jgi:hypothetical protein
MINPNHPFHKEISDEFDILFLGRTTMKKIILLTALVLYFLGSFNCYAENKQSVNLKDLESSERQVRRAAFDALVDIPIGPSGMGVDLDKIKLKKMYTNNDEVKKQLRKLIKIEDGVLNKRKHSTYSAEAREVYLDYRYALMSLLVSFGDTEDIQYILSHNNPSILLKLAKLGEPVVEPVLKKFKDGGGLDKHMAAVMLSAMAKSKVPKFPYSNASKNKIKKGLIAAVKHKGSWQIRANAIEGMKWLTLQGHKELIEIIERFAEDSYVMEDGTAPVREEAQKALKEIKKHLAKQKQQKKEKSLKKSTTEHNKN